MAFYKITFEDNRPDIYVKHFNGDQMMFEEIQALVGDAPARNDYPLCLELDGWADDMAAPGDTYETDYGFTVECISEEEYREETGQKDVPRHLLD